jgi:hypothetical protein
MKAVLMFLIGGVLFLMLAINGYGKQRTEVLYPLDEDFAGQGAGYITLAEGMTWTGIFRFERNGSKRNYLGTAEVWILGDSTAVGDADNITVIAQPLFYDATDDTMRLSTTTALVASGANTDQSQLATIAYDSLRIVWNFDYTSTDFVIHRQADVGLCDGILLSIILDATTGSIRFKPRVYILTDR